MKNGGTCRRPGDTIIGKMSMTPIRITLWITVAAICGLTFVWPALAPDERQDAAYQVAAVAAMWLFIAALAALLWEKARAEKACKVPRT